MSRPRAARLLAVALALAPAAARAHHVPGHGASEGVRTINSLNGAGGRANTRLLLINEFVYTGFGLNPGTMDSLSLVGEYAPRPWLSFALQAPLLMFRAADTQGETRVGYGDTRVQVRVTPHASKLIHRVLTAGLNASLPTRTVRFTVDPGPIVAVAPYVVFTRTYMTWYWQVLAISTVDIRRAGVAVDFGASGQVGARLANGKVNLGVGLLLDTRLAAFCTLPEGGREFCPGNRAGELYRDLGTARGTGLMAVSYNFHRRGSLVGSVQVPFTRLRDYTIGWSLGLQVFF
ncbi:hypothetical protein [Nannocystis pusilla]|uniref:hypothetical protein n=1 Tax=Nannocystis pusilla TaxID=889268 RepID=UPI003DA6527E